MVLLVIVASITTAVIWSVSLTLMNIVVSSSASDLGTNYAIVTLRIASLALLFTAFSPFIDKKHDFIRISKKTIVVLCLGGLFANGLGWILMNYSFLFIPETMAVPISSTSPLFAALTGFIFFSGKSHYVDDFRCNFCSNRNNSNFCYLISRNRSSSLYLEALLQLKSDASTSLFSVII
jgi:drug/metabolite transporter (DMT)-like permease